MPHLHPELVLGASLAYLLALFAVAWWADRRAMAVAITHMTEYALGAVVLVVLMIYRGT